MKINIPYINKQEIECIIFDLGGVILDINFDKTIEAFNNLQIEGLRAEDIFVNNQTLFLNLELGTINPSDFITCFQEIYPAAKKVPTRSIWKAWNALLLSYRKEKIDLLKKLSKHYKLYLLSNTNLPHRMRFKEMYEDQFGENFEDLFIRCFYSDEMHLRKPNLEIYQEVSLAIGIEKSKILFIDDSKTNIDVAKEYGWHIYHLTNNESIVDLFI